MRKLRILALGFIAMFLLLVAFRVLSASTEGHNPIWTFFRPRRDRWCEERVTATVVSPNKHFTIVRTTVNCLATFDEQVVYLREGSSESKSRPFGDPVLEVSGRNDIYLEVPDEITINVWLWDFPPADIWTPAEVTPDMFRDKWHNVRITRVPLILPPNLE